MNREQIEKEKQILKEMTKVLEDGLARLESQLESSEPAKLRHGMAIIWDRQKEPRLILKLPNSETLQEFNEDGFYGTVDDVPFTDYTILTPNIFDDLAAMSREINSFELDVNEYYINLEKGLAHAPIHIAGNNHTLEEAEQFWRDFGAMLCNYKNKQATAQLKQSGQNM